MEAGVGSKDFISSPIIPRGDLARCVCTFDKVIMQFYCLLEARTEKKSAIKLLLSKQNLLFQIYCLHRQQLERL